MVEMLPLVKIAPRLSSGAIFTKGNISTILLPPYCSSSFGQSPDHLTDAALASDAPTKALIDINHPKAPMIAITHHALVKPIPSSPIIAIDMKAVVAASFKVVL